MEKLILILTIVCSIVKVNCLQCYVCNDCTTVNDSHLVTCGVSVITTTGLPTATTTISNITSAINATIVTNATTPVTTAQTLTHTTTTLAPPVSETNTTSASNNTMNNSTIKTQSELRTKREVVESNFGDINPGYRASNTTLVSYCYKGTIKVNTKEKIVRGCASKPESSNQTICDDMATDPLVTACRTCLTDKCNSAFTARISLILLIIATSLSVY